MLLVCWVSCLKLSHTPRWFIGLYAIVLGLFVYMSSDLASSQTRDSIASYIEQYSLREYITILVTIEAIILVTFAFWRTHTSSSATPRPKCQEQVILIALRFYPPILTLPTLLYLHTTLLFNWTGVDFELLSLGLAFATTLFFALVPSFIGYLLPEREIRLELLCLSSFFIFLLGLITTVDNHLVYEAPEYDFPLKGFLLALGLGSACFILGYFVPLGKRLINKNK